MPCTALLSPPIGQYSRLLSSLRFQYDNAKKKIDKRHPRGENGEQLGPNNSQVSLYKIRPGKLEYEIPFLQYFLVTWSGKLFNLKIYIKSY